MPENQKNEKIYEQSLEKLLNQFIGERNSSTKQITRLQEEITYLKKELETQKEKTKEVWAISIAVTVLLFNIMLFSSMGKVGFAIFIWEIIVFVLVIHYMDIEEIKQLLDRILKGIRRG